MHRVYWAEQLPAVGEAVTIRGDEAAHSLRVKRMRAGEPIELLDGIGGVAAATISGPAMPLPGGRGGLGLMARVVAIRHEDPPSPAVQVWAATPKGASVDEMVEGLSEVGATSWVPMHTDRAIVEPRQTKLDRLSRLATESAKQCGRAWLFRIEAERSFADALIPAPGVHIVFADASGRPFRPEWPAPVQIVRLLIGPEGGWSPEEADRAAASGATTTRFGPHTMRIETAAVAAAAIVVDQLGSAAT